MLLTYYLFLVASLVLVAVFYRSSVWSQPRKSHIAYLLIPPLILFVSIMNLGVVVTALLSILLIVVVNRMPRRYADAPVTGATVFYSVALWVAEIVVPLTLHLALRSRPDTERWSLLVSGVIFLFGTLLLFVVLAPDIAKKA